MGDPYVTPDRFKTMGFGIDFDDIEDFELRSILRRASDRVNAICAAPALPQQHDFRGGSITGEQHLWRMGDGNSQSMQRSVFLWHTPLRTVTDLRIRLTNSQGIVFDPGELIVFEKTVEIVSLAMSSVGLFGAFIVPEIGLAQPRIQADYTYGYQVPVAGETLEATDGLMYRAQDQWWDATATTTVYRDGVQVTTGYTIDHNEGAVLFTASQAADSVITADYTTKLPRGIASATGILAAEAIGESRMTARGMSGLAGIRVGEIELQRVQQMRGGTTLVTPGLAEAQEILQPFKFIWAGA